MSMRALIKSLTSAFNTSRRARHSAFFARLSVEPLDDRRVLSFAPLVSYPVDLDPGAVVAGDFNADGRPDLAAANVSSNTVSVLLGNGDGTFQPARSSDAGDAHALVAGDLNGDGKTDLVTYNNSSFESDGKLHVLLSNGDGTFQLPQSVVLPPQFPPGYTGASALSQGVSSVALGDLNGDGKLDLVATGATFYDVLNGYGDYGEPIYVRVSQFYVNVLPGHGDGTFSSGNVYNEVYLGQVCLGDFNNDGRLDVVHNGGYDLSARLGNGDGTLQSAQLSYVEAGFGPPVDSNSDGNLDLLPALGNGDGTFSRGDPGAYGNVDVNSDHKFDLLSVANNYDENGVIWATTVDVRLGRGDGTFSQPITSVLATFTRDYFGGSLLADFDGNGFPDLAGPVSDSLDNTLGFVGVSLNDGVWEEPPPPPPSVEIGDVTVTEGDSGMASAVFTVSLAGAHGSVSVNYATQNGAAIAGSDYSARSGTLTFAASEFSKTISVPVYGDILDEYNEGFYVNLSNAVNGLITDGQGKCTIVDNDPAPLVTINNVSRYEGNTGTTSFVFTVSLLAVSGRWISLGFATANATATVAGNDYYAASGTVSIAPGQTTATITVKVRGDKHKEANETFFLNLTAADGATISDSQGLGTILNDDANVKVASRKLAAALMMDDGQTMRKRK